MWRLKNVHDLLRRVPKAAVECDVFNTTLPLRCTETAKRSGNETGTTDFPSVRQTIRLRHLVTIDAYPPPPWRSHGSTSTNRYTDVDDNRPSYFLPSLSSCSTSSSDEECDDDDVDSSLLKFLDVNLSMFTWCRVKSAIFFYFHTSQNYLYNMVHIYY